MIEKHKSREELLRVISRAAALVKMACGVANNNAILIMLDAYGEVSGRAFDKDGQLKPRHPGFKHQAKAAYKRALSEMHLYESRLLYASHNRFFCMDDMAPETRKSFGDITDKEYFEFWKGLGSEAYDKTRPLVTSLWNKYRLSLINHGVKMPETMAWVATASAALKLAGMIYRGAVDDTVRQGVPRKVADSVFKDFSIRRVSDAWDAAMNATDSTRYKLDEIETRNISAGLLQLSEAWISPDILYGSIIEAIPQFDDIFRTKGEMKKTLRSINEAMSATIDEMRKT